MEQTERYGGQYDDEDHAPWGIGAFPGNREGRASGDALLRYAPHGRTPTRQRPESGSCWPWELPYRHASEIETRPRQRGKKAKKGVVRLRRRKPVRPRGIRTRKGWRMANGEWRVVDRRESATMGVDCYVDGVSCSGMGEGRPAVVRRRIPSPAGLSSLLVLPSIS